MKLKSICDIKNLAGKRVLLRADLDVPIKNGKVTDDARIRLAVPTIKYLIKEKAIVLILAHLGRPDGQVVPNLTLAPVAKKLTKILNHQVLFLTPKWNEECLFASQLKVSGLGAVLVKKSVVSELIKLKGGQVVLLENIRFDNREEKNSESFAKKLSAIADLYVNDAFATSHRQASSVLAITKFLPSFAGLRLVLEVQRLQTVLKKPKRPLVVIMGGIKISTKLPVIKKFLAVANGVLLGGALANTVLRAKGVAVGKSVVEAGMTAALKKINLTDTKLHLPVDAVVAKKLSPAAKVRTTAVGNVKTKELILDIGPDTTELFVNIIKSAKTIIWNGPMGVFEFPKFAAGTKAIIKAVLHANAKVIIGGGDSLAALEKFSPKPKLSVDVSSPTDRGKNIYISTGGGAMLKFLEEGTLVALKALKSLSS